LKQPSAILPDQFTDFGVLLKYLRRRAGLTQRELSIAVGYSHAHISRLELNQRPPDRATLAARFVPALHLEHEPAWVARLLALAAPQAQPAGNAAPADTAAGTPAHNLPLQLTSFVGRDKEIATVGRLLTGARLVTLTGSGGAGKTRLALRVAAEALPAFPDGAWLVELASLADPARVPQTAAAVLGVRAAGGRAFVEALIDALRPKACLLLLDNCEHLVEASAQLAQALLQACPRVQILATSRETLGIPGETAFRVPSLSTPDARQVPAVEALMLSEAACLFVERAAAALPGFAATDDNALAIARICRRLDGVPLALELAAARVRLLRVEQVAARLDDMFALLTDGGHTALPRHRTLRAAIDWSYALLTEPERLLLRRLSVFAGGCTLQAAEAICAGEGVDAAAVLDTLTQLSNKSLVIAERAPGHEARYRMLETVRHYTWEKLLAAGEASAVQARLAAWFEALATRAEVELRGPRQREWLDRLGREQDNLRAALAWALEHDAAAAVRLGATLGQFWFTRGQFYGEGMEWLERVLARPAAPGQTPMRAKAFRWLGMLAEFQRSYAVARSAHEQSLALHRELGDLQNVAEAHMALGNIAADLGDAEAARSLYAAARAAYEQSLSDLRALGDRWKLATSFNALGEVTRLLGDYAAARLLYEQSLALRRELDDRRGIAVSLINLGAIAHHHGDDREAAELFRQSLTLFHELDSTRGIVDCLAALGGVAGGSGHPARAARLFGAAEALRAAFDSGIAYPERREIDRDVAAARAQLDEESFGAAWAEGRAMTLERAIAYALEPASG
jgi:non-specific serine/threonine protein kinase